MIKFIITFGLCLAILGISQAQDRNLKKFKPAKNMVALELLKGNATLKVGQKAYLQYEQHGSVGIGGELEIADNTILKIVDKHICYDKAHIKGMTGDDRATITLVVQALKIGSSDATFKKIFRGQTEEQHSIAVTVTQ